MSADKLDDLKRLLRARSPCPDLAVEAMEALRPIFGKDPGAPYGLAPAARLDCGLAARAVSAIIRIPLPIIEPVSLAGLLTPPAVEALRLPLWDSLQGRSFYRRLSDEFVGLSLRSGTAALGRELRGQVGGLFAGLYEAAWRQALAANGRLSERDIRWTMISSHWWLTLHDGLSHYLLACGLGDREAVERLRPLVQLLSRAVPLCVGPTGSWSVLAA